MGVKKIEDLDSQLIMETRQKIKNIKKEINDLFNTLIHSKDKKASFDKLSKRLEMFNQSLRTLFYYMDFNGDMSGYFVPLVGEIKKEDEFLRKDRKELLEVLFEFRERFSAEDPNDEVCMEEYLENYKDFCQRLDHLNSKEINFFQDFYCQELGVCD